MIKALKNIAVGIFAILFLIVSTGAYINFHHCEITGDTEVMLTVPESENCCSSHSHNESSECKGNNECNRKQCSGCSSKKLPENDIYLNNNHCCSDNLLYLILPDDYLNNHSFSEQNKVPEIKFYPEGCKIIYSSVISTGQKHVLTSIPPPITRSGKYTVFKNRQLIL